MNTIIQDCLKGVESVDRITATGYSEKVPLVFFIRHITLYPDQLHMENIYEIGATLNEVNV
jgi:hypothetical protein